MGELLSPSAMGRGQGDMLGGRRGPPLPLPGQMSVAGLKLQCRGMIVLWVV